MKYRFFNPHTSRLNPNGLTKTTNYYIGDEVYIVDMGQIYSTYRGAYEQLGLDINNVLNTNYSNRLRLFPYYKRFKVVGFAFHESYNDLLVGLKNEDTNVVVSCDGVRKAYRFGATTDKINDVITIDTPCIR